MMNSVKPPGQRDGMHQPVHPIISQRLEDQSRAKNRDPRDRELSRDPRQNADSRAETIPTAGNRLPMISDAMVSPKFVTRRPSPGFSFAAPGARKSRRPRSPRTSEPAPGRLRSPTSRPVSNNQLAAISVILIRVEGLGRHPDRGRMAWPSREGRRGNSSFQPPRHRLLQALPRPHRSPASASGRSCPRAGLSGLKRRDDQ